MMWFIFTAGVITLFLLMLVLAPCASKVSGCQAGVNQPKDLSLSDAAQNCTEMLESIEHQKRQLQNRLDMLEELIEKSDREIIRLHDQLSRWP